MPLCHSTSEGLKGPMLELFFTIQLHKRPEKCTLPVFRICSLKQVVRTSVRLWCHKCTVPAPQLPAELRSKYRWSSFTRAGQNAMKLGTDFQAPEGLIVNLGPPAVKCLSSRAVASLDIDIVQTFMFPTGWTVSTFDEPAEFIKRH